MYACFKRRPRVKQMSFDDLWFGNDSDFIDEEGDLAMTTTYKMDAPSARLQSAVNITAMIERLEEFNKKYRDLIETDRKEMFSTFYREKSDKGMKNVFKLLFRSQKKYVPCDTKEFCSKVAGIVDKVKSQHREEEHEELFEACKAELMEYLEEVGFDTKRVDFEEIMSNSFRKISAPDFKLAMALRELKNIIEVDFCQDRTYVPGRIPEMRMHHTSAFAYVKKRSTVDAIKRHQKNESKWFGKFDLTNFFGSTTVPYTMKMFGMVFPFCQIINRENGKQALETALSLAFLDGGLPQGTPISPLITNVIMIPVDYELFKGFRGFHNQTFVYTRYADDFLVSSRRHFDVKEVEKYIVDTLHSFGAPFTIKEEKTRYGSSAGSNWNLGLMLNKDNQITVGHEKKRIFRAELSSYVMDKLSGSEWSLNEIQVMEGTRSYYNMIEPDAINAIVQKVNTKFKVDVLKMIKADLKRLA